MQVVTSIRNRQFVESFSEVNARLKSQAAVDKRTSERYAMVDTETVIKRVFELAIEQGLHVDRTKVATRGKGSLHTVRIRFTALLSPNGGEYPVGRDSGHPELTIMNSYNGECSLKFNLGFYRLICSNGLTIPMPGFDEVNYDSGKRRHIAGPKMSEFNRHLDERIIAALEGLKGLGAKFEQMSSMAVSRGQEATIIAQLGLTKGQRKQYDSIRGGVYGRDTEGNLWAIYNAVNEAIRRSQRSEFATEMRNIDLLANVEEAFTNAQVA